MRALEAPELWDELLAYSSNDKPIDNGTIQTFRTIFFPESKGKRRGRKPKMIKVEFDRDAVFARMEELNLKQYHVGERLGRSQGYFYNILKQRKVFKHQISELNDILGGEYFKAVED